MARGATTEVGSQGPQGDDAYLNAITINNALTHMGIRATRAQGHNDK